MSLSIVCGAADMPLGCKHAGKVLFAFRGMFVCDHAVLSLTSFLIVLICLPVTCNVQQHRGNSYFFCTPPVKCKLQVESLCSAALTEDMMFAHHSRSIEAVRVRL